MITYSGADFVRALSSENGLTAPQNAITLTGAVKPVAIDFAEALLFSLGTSCWQWTPIPVSLIESVDHLGKITCDNHEHDYVRLLLKKPATEEANLFASLLQALITSRETLEVSDFTDEPFTTMELVGKSFPWRPPWTWSRCAKCKLEVNAFITGSVLVAAAAAGTTGPGAIAVWQALITAKYGLAAWRAIEAYIFSEGVDSISKRICKSLGKC